MDALEGNTLHTHKIMQYTSGSPHKPASVGSDQSRSLYRRLSAERQTFTRVDDHFAIGNIATRRGKLLLNASVKLCFRYAHYEFHRF